MFFKRMIDNPDIAKLLLRLSLGGLMLFHGVHKVMHGIGFIQQAVAGPTFPSGLVTVFMLARCLPLCCYCLVILRVLLPCCRLL